MSFKLELYLGPHLSKFTEANLSLEEHTWRQAKLRNNYKQTNQQNDADPAFQVRTSNFEDH